MLGPLSYNLLFGRPWIHALGVVNYTFHSSIKFVSNNQVVSINVDPYATHLSQITTFDYVLVTPLFQNYIPSLSFNMLTTILMDLDKDKTHDKVIFQK